MNKKIFFILFTLLFHLSTWRAEAAIGDWKAYMAYHDVQEIEQAGNLIFIQASNGLYVYNKNDQSIQTFSKVNYLNDSEIQHIAYCKTAKKLMIIYTNSNIDLMNVANYECTNLSDYYNASITGDKSVNDIYIIGNYAYLSNGFGIIKINIANCEISDTYNLGFKVDWCEVGGNYIYAYSQTKGKYKAFLSTNLLDKNNWTRVGDYIAKTQTDKSELKQLVSTLNPGGPKYNHFGFMKFANGQLYTCGGSVGGQNNACIQLLKEGDWHVFQDENISEKTGVGYKDIVCLDFDPLDNKHIFAGGRNGLYEFYDEKFKAYYNKDNSLIQPYDGKDKEYQLTQGVKFDSNGNLWILNSQAPTQSLIEYNTNKEWRSHSKPELMKLDDEGFKNKSLGSLQNMMIDSRGLLWFVNNHWIIPSLYCYQISSDAIKGYTSFSNQDGSNISVGSVRTVVEDNKGNLWVGTNVGPLLLEADQITADQTVFNQVKVPRNDGTNYADYLLNNVDINCIAIDKANRKWFGTNGNGVYLISANNIEQLEHFTKSNSKLLSDNIEAIAIDENTGEVFFGTDKGLCSYESGVSSINDEMTKNNVWAYPNPVKPDYTGYITITGLAINATVMILTSNGSLVHQGKSSTGFYRWDGRDLKGKKVASGIYMVATATENGEKGTVCKIAIIK